MPSPDPAAPDPGRPDPDALLAALRRDQPNARLKIYLGAAPGVGKTVEMLADGNRRLANGEDVVAGVIETHGRADTEAAIGKLPRLALRSLSHRGRALAEFDLDAALARRPDLLLVDELAHTNAPGSRHAKRWEDVAELVRAGISVHATLNVQHLESLNDDIARLTGIRPAETLPDRVLEMADEIELVDLPPAELRQRLREGKIYRPEQAQRALENFFREGNLAGLRELALRRAAARVDQDIRGLMRSQGLSGPNPAAERIIALVGPDRSGEVVIRRAKQLADALHAAWLALHIEPLGEDPSQMLRVQQSLDLARALGAETLVLPAGGLALSAAMAQACRDQHATHVVIGRSTPTAAIIWGYTHAARLLSHAPDLVLHIVPQSAAQPPQPPVMRRPDGLGGWRWAAPVVLVGGVTAIGHMLRHALPVEAADMVYVAAVVLTAIGAGTGPALLTAILGVLAWDFFFIVPLYTVTISRPRDILTGVIFAIVALLTGSLAGRARAQADAATSRIEGMRRLSTASRRLAEAATEPALLAEIANQAAAIGESAVVLGGPADSLICLAQAQSPPPLDEGDRAAARWAAQHAEPTGRGTATLPTCAFRFQPMQTPRGMAGVIGICQDGPMLTANAQAFATLADQAALALERIRLAAEAARGAAWEDTQKLRTALLASLGHDLRTPLTAIQGAASTLRTAWAQLDAETREDLLAVIEQDVGRMSAFLSNLTELTRLESGQIRPRLAAIRLHDTVAAAVSRLANSLFVAVHVPEDLLAEADAALLEQALFNVLDNALKYAPAGSLVRIAGGALPREGKVWLSIADEGVGIPAEDIAHVFDSFFRASRGDRVAAGTGLGLAIARGLVTAMGGQITAQSPRPDAPLGGFPGTVITITLVAAAAPPLPPRRQHD